MAAFTADDATEALPKGSSTAKAAWVKMANKAMGRGMSRDDAAAAATKMAGQMQEARRLHMDLAEVGRVLSATNEKQLRTAAAAIDAVLRALDAGEEPAAEALRTVEAYSPEAGDAARGAGIMASLSYAAQDLLYLISDESDEPDQVAMLQKAYDALALIPPLVQVWIAAEIGEIGSPDDGNDDDCILCGCPYVCSCTICDCLNHVSPGVLESAHQLEGDVIPILESALRGDGTMDVCLIKPGWGVSGYYTPEVLRRDGPVVFNSGTHMFADHPGYAEEADRPERSIRDLAGVLAGDAYYNENGPVGPGLYAKAQPVSNFREVLNELAPHIGVSIRTKGLGKTGEAEGKRGPIIEKLLPDQLRSADFVTVAAAGGQVLPVAEAWRRIREALPALKGPIEDYADPVNHVFGPINTPKDVHDCAFGLGRGHGDHEKIKARIIAIAKRKGPEFVAALPDAWKEDDATEAARRRAQSTPRLEDTSMDLQETQRALAAAEAARETALAEAARAKEALVLREARDVVVAELAKAQIPDVTRARLADTLGKNPPVKEGALDKEALVGAVKEAVAAEVAYLASITGSGQIKGMGGTSAGAGPTPEELDKSLTESFRAIGLDEKTAKLAAAGRN